jgi:GDP/UDP-N,N'-diacetylbacillosamine 2-epimerase (hydrolysing)
MGLAMIGYGEAIERLRPDIVLLLGDRFETFCMAAAALVAKIPVAHISGGEITEGAFDDALRHSITKMSHLHFVSVEEYRRRIIQLGEHPDRVFTVGALGVENIDKLKLLARHELEDWMQFSLGDRCILVTFHPVTLAKADSTEQFEVLLQAIDSFSSLRVIFTKANADTAGRSINCLIDVYVEKNKHKAIAFASMGRLRYLSAVKHVDAVVGNSSSGIIEAPSFSVPTVNIGDRQRGRLLPKSIINCTASREDIVCALRKTFSKEFIRTAQETTNPYHKQNTARNIQEIIKKFDLNNILQKRFYDISMKEDCIEK